MRFLWPEVVSLPRPFLGLGRWRTREQFRGAFQYVHAATRAEVLSPTAPWGWRWLKVEDRNAAICLPLWLYWPIYAWRYRWNIVCDPLMRLGLWCVEEEGGYYWDGRPTFPAWVRRTWWCFLHDRDTSPDPCWECGRINPEGERCGWLQCLWHCQRCVDRHIARRLAAFRARVYLRQRSA